jgi:arylsulfatase A-like enzyme
MGRPPSYFSPYKNPKISDGPDGEYLTDRLADEACDFIVQNKEQLFFLNLWFYNVHTPLQAKQKTIEKYKALVDSTYPQRNPIYAAMVEHTDDAVGKIVAELQKQGLMENTIIVFTSDNGGLVGNPNAQVTSNLPLRSGKGSMYEGGVRVPAFIVAPGVSTAGMECNEPIVSPDFFPTLMELTDIEVNKLVKKGFDGKSIVPLLNPEGKIDREAIYWHYPHYHTEGAVPYSAIRKGKWRLIQNYQTNTYELYNLENDIGEQHNMAETEPEIREELIQDLEKWKKKVGAQMPMPNPDYDKEKADLFSWQVE